MKLGLRAWNLQSWHPFVTLMNEKHEVIRTASNGCVGNSNYGTSEICGIALNRKNGHRGRKIPPTMPVFHEFGTILHWRKKQG